MRTIALAGSRMQTMNTANRLSFAFRIRRITLLLPFRVCVYVPAACVCLLDLDSIDDDDDDAIKPENGLFY